MNSNVKEKKLVMTFLFEKCLLAPMCNNDLAVNYIKNIISKNALEEESTLKRIIKSVKDFPLKEQKEKWFKVLNLRNNQLFNNVNDKLDINDKTEQ